MPRRKPQSKRKKVTKKGRGRPGGGLGRHLAIWTAFQEELPAWDKQYLAFEAIEPSLRARGLFGPARAADPTLGSATKGAVNAARLVFAQLQAKLTERLKQEYLERGLEWPDWSKRKRMTSVDREIYDKAVREVFQEMRLKLSD